MTNKIHKQKGGTCAGTAVANAIEAHTGVSVEESFVTNFYKKHDPNYGTKYEGMHVPTIARHTKETPMAGYHVEDMEHIFSTTIRGKVKDGFRLINVIHALRDPDRAMVINLRIHGSDEYGIKFPLDKDYFYEPGDRQFPYYHAMFACAEVRRNGRHGVMVENSWGHKWGLDGMFFIDFKTFHRYVGEAYSFKVVKA